MQSQFDLSHLDADALYELANNYLVGNEVYKKNELLAVQYFSLAGKKGNFNAQIQVAKMYELGLCVKQDKNLAKQWYIFAAKNSDVHFQYQFASKLMKGDGLDRDDATAIKWFSRAAKQGLPEAQYYFASMLAKGYGRKQNLVKAKNWFMVAAAQGHPDAQYALGQIFEKDSCYPKAFFWYQEAAKKGHVKAQIESGAMLEEGRGITKDEKKAFYWYERAAKTGDPEAETHLGDMYLSGKAVVPSSDTAITWYELAANKNYIEAQSNLGKLYAFGLKNPNYEKAAYWFKRAAKNGDVDSLYHLGFIHEHERIEKKDNADSIYWYREAAYHHHAESQFRLGVLYERGIGVEQNIKLSLYWYQKAVGNHSHKALYQLGLIYENGKFVKKNDTKAIYFFQRAVREKNLDALSHLALMMKEGRGIQKNEELAHHHFQLLSTHIQSESSKTEEITLSDIHKEMISAKSYIPKMWPLPIDQKGPCCGLYALHTAISYGLKDTIKTPPARKNGNKALDSFRAITKKKHQTLVGEVHDVHIFDELTRHFHIPNCKIINENEKIKKDKYINTICDHLKHGYSVIASANINHTNFPGSTHGQYGAHWALIYGYYFSRHENKYKFLVTQFGKYYEWDAEALYESNFEIPAGNALRRMELDTYQDKNSWKKRWDQEKEKLKDIADEKLTPCRIRFRLFGVLKIPTDDSDLDKKPASLTCVKPLSP